MRLSTVKKTMMATALAVAAAAAVVGAPSNALALGFNVGDLGFFVFGGNDQRYESFGANSALSTLEGTSLTTRDISGSLTSLSVGVPAGLGLSYSILGTSGSDFYLSSTATTITTTMINNSDPNSAAGNFLGWAGQHAAQTGGVLANNPSITAASAAHSYTSFLGTDGSIVGAMNFSTQGSLGQLLNIFRVNVDGEPQTYVRVATALLGTNGQFTITPSAVPIPAAVYLFGTGLVALVGIARRSMNKNKMAA